MSIDYVDDYFWLSCWLFLAEERKELQKETKTNARKKQQKEKIVY